MKTHTFSDFECGPRFFQHVWYTAGLGLFSVPSSATGGCISSMICKTSVVLNLTSCEGFSFCSCAYVVRLICSSNSRSLLAFIHKCTAPYAKHPTIIFRRMMTSLPSTMKGIIIENSGGSDVLQYRTSLPLPEPGEGRILVKNDFIGVNFIDT